VNDRQTLSRPEVRSGLAVLTTPAGTEHEVFADLHFRTIGGHRTAEGSLYGELDGVAWFELFGVALALRFQGALFRVRVVAALENFAEVEDAVTGWPRDRVRELRRALGLDQTDA
jgi:hypothetical protein